MSADNAGAEAGGEEACHPAATQATVETAEDGQAGSSSSSSSSSRSRSRSSSSSARSEHTARFVIDDEVEVFGLESENGRELNGRKGVVLQYIEATGRCEVKFGPEQVALLRPDKLRRRRSVAGAAAVAPGCAAAAAAQGAPPPIPKAKESKPASLASLLGFGRQAVAEEPKPAVYQSVWDRNTGSGESAAKAEVLHSEFLPEVVDSTAEEEALRTMMQNEADRARELEAIRAKVVAEFAQGGIFDEGMIDEAYKQQLEEHDLQKVLRPESYAQESQRKAKKPRTEGGCSRSASSSGSGKKR